MTKVIQYVVFEFECLHVSSLTRILLFYAGQLRRIPQWLDHLPLPCECEVPKRKVVVRVWVVQVAVKEALGKPRGLAAENKLLRRILAEAAGAFVVLGVLDEGQLFLGHLVDRKNVVVEERARCVETLGEIVQFSYSKLVSDALVLSSLVVAEIFVNQVLGLDEFFLVEGVVSCSRGLVLEGGVTNPAWLLGTVVHSARLLL